MSNLSYQQKESGVPSKKIFDFIHSTKKMAQYRSSEKDFTRKSPLSFPVIVTSILHLFKESVEFNLHKLLGGFENKPVTGSAFSQARYKIKPDFFKSLNAVLRSGYDQANKLLWKGYLLIGGDGSTINLPPSESIEEHFGIYSSTDQGTKTYLARTFFLYDVLNDFVLDAQLSKMEVGEKTLLLQSLKNDFPTKSIFLLDRGFGHFSTLQELVVRTKDYCVRLSSSSNFAKRMLQQPENDIVTVWYPSPKERESCVRNGLKPTPIKVRIVKILLKTGETELLATSLTDQQKYSTEDINELYHCRWGVEEGFKNLKPKMKVEQFGTRKPEGVLQEFYAHIFCMNLIGLFGQQADKIIKQKTKHRKLTYQYNWQNTFRMVRENIVEWLTSINVEALIEKLINSISYTMTAVKPDRSFVRDSRNMKKKLRTTQFHK